MTEKIKIVEYKTSKCCGAPVERREEVWDNAFYRARSTKYVAGQNGDVCMMCGQFCDVVVELMEC
jgi:hypothetical protein